MSRWSERLARIEFVLLCIFALALPILESPKNIAAALLLFIWVVTRIVTKNISLRRPDLVEIALLFMISATALSTAINLPFENGFKGLKDVLLQCFVFWLIYNWALTERLQIRLVEMIALGVLIGLIWSIVLVYQGWSTFIQFHSAGIVSQSAIYLGTATIMALCVAWFADKLDSVSALPVWYRVLWWLICAFMTSTLVLMGSRGPLIATLFAMLAIGVLTLRKALVFTIVGIIALSLVVTVGFAGRFATGRVVTKTQELLSGNFSSSDQERIAQWRIAFAQIKQGNALIVGIGPRNYASIDLAQLSFDPPLSRIPRLVLQAHNMFLHKLIEEGIIGLASLLFFFAVVIWRLVEQRRADRWGRWQWFAALGALIVPIVSGQFSDPWRQEHGLLAMILLALALSPVPLKSSNAATASRVQDRARGKLAPGSFQGP